MSKNVVAPKSVSFEDALRNLASRLTGRPAAELPRTQEGIVQFMAENVPTPDEMGEAITQEVMARIKPDEIGEAITQEVVARLTAASAPTEEDEPEKPNTAQQEGHNGSDAPGGTSYPWRGRGTQHGGPCGRRQA